jgi:hypothetical protein
MGLPSRSLTRQDSISLAIRFVMATGSAMIVCLALAVSSRAGAADAEPSSPSKETSYLPSISDFMIATIQPRHIRLWIAAQNSNWPFAAYELGNLRGAFDRLGRAHPTDEGVPIKDMIASVTTQPFADLDKAIQAKDAAGFTKAYANLTAACNACHQGANHGVIAIRVPRDSSSDQEFAPANP